MAKRKAQKLDETQLKALVAAEIQDAELYQTTEVSGERERAINYYNGEMPDTPAADGWSTFKSRDVSDVMGWVLPGIIRVFTASDRIVDYQPRRPNDEEFTDQASDYANYIFWNDNPGYRILWDATHDSLLMADGIVKTYWDDSEECDYSVHSGLSIEALTLLTQEPDVEVVSQDMKPLTLEDGMGGSEVIETFDVKIKRVTSAGRIKMEAIEPENFLIDKESITIKDARFVAHRDPHMTRSGLIEMGFDKDVVDAIPRYSATASGRAPEEQARNQFSTSSALGDKSMDRIELYECYVRADMNDDGIAETVRVYYAGNMGAGEMLDWEVWDDETPFSSIPCEPVPHRFTSRSLSGEVMDVQQIKTVLYRQMLNNTYQVNNPQKDIEAGAVINMDELINPTIGGLVIRKVGSQPVNYNVVPSIMTEALGAIEAMDRVTEMRTGISAATMALDPQTLQNQTATASNNQADSRYSQVELIARNQAELGWKDVFGKILRLIVKHQDRPRMIRLRDEWVEMDPRQWNSGMDAVINVGLGTGSRDRDMSMLNNIFMSQVALTDRFQAAGMTEQALDMIPKIIKTLVKIAEAAGIRNADDFYPDITIDDLPALKEMAAKMAEQPSPEVQMAQAKAEADMQVQQAKIAGDQQKAQADIALQQQKDAANLQLEQQKMAMEMQFKREQLAAEISLKREQLIAELALKREQIGAELELKRESNKMNAEVKASATSGVSVGGEPG
jgi:hypothetical protein